ncbi:DUF1694 domain-containing protein, partial [Lacticaseibacillus paracasei]|nr:DUF1694 domain-containing protein [Lacticaseibacillus paracasei]
SNVDLPPLEQDSEKPKKRGFDFFKKL